MLSSECWQAIERGREGERERRRRLLNRHTPRLIRRILLASWIADEEGGERTLSEKRKSSLS